MNKYTKIERLASIESTIAGDNISTQEELLKRLVKQGIKCTQATLSRDLRQLGVARIPDGSGGYRYAMPESLRMKESNPVRLNIVPVITDLIEANGLMVIKTIPGNASNTAFFIDNAGRYEIAGTIAGDDTILLIPRDGISLSKVHTCLEMILPGIHDNLRRS